MSTLADFNPTSRFSGLADIYAKYRPGYPLEALDYIMSRCQLGPNSLLVDVGCGTGISSRLFAMRGVPVIGIEPNAEMRQRAAAELLSPGMPIPVCRDGTAEATGLADAHVDVVLAAQAFHWFEPNAALQEFHRILKPEGWVVVVGYERDETDACTEAYGAVVGSTKEAARVEKPRQLADRPLLASDLFKDAERRLFANEQELDEVGLLGRAFSASFAPKEPVQIEAHTAALRAIFARFQKAGKVILRYQTSVTCAQRRSTAVG